MSRKLSLRREVLTELAADELRAVVGASGIVCDITDYPCLPTENCTGYYPSLNAPCTE